MQNKLYIEETAMDINIPKTATVSHELPIFNELSQESGLPISEVKARFRRKMLELHEKALDDPSTMPMGGDSQDMVHAAVNELRKELQHPEEETDDESEYDEIMGFDPSEQAPGSDIFDDGGDFGDFGDFGAGGGFGDGFGGGGGFGGGFGGGGGGIDNLDLGFSDEGMDAVNSVSEEGFGDFGSEDDGGSVNAMSEIEPGASGEESTETETEDSGESPDTDSDLAEG